MFNIFLIEDQAEFSRSIKSFIEGFFTEEKVKYKLSVFNTGFKNILQCIEASQKNIYIVDVALGTDYDGFDLAKEIRAIDSSGYLMFLTSHDHLAYRSFDYHLRAIHYIAKQSSYEKALGDVFKTILNEQVTEEDMITFKYRQKITTLNCDDILYVETYHVKRTLVVHTRDEEHFYHGTLKDIMEELPDYFLRCHKSFILNPKHIKELDITFSQYMVLFGGKKSCMLSKKFISDPVKLLKLKEAYEN